jgi:trk system potassium uptake protein TrkH
MPDSLLYRAVSVALLSIAFVFIVAFRVEVLAGTPFVDTTFETISAFGTVGLTTGITPTLPDGARILVAVAMFVGRLGPLTLVIALAARERSLHYRPALESMRIG